MSKINKTIISQSVSLVLGWLIGVGIIKFINVSYPDFMRDASFGALVIISLIFVNSYLFSITFISNLLFQKLSKWNYLIPAILILVALILDGGFWLGTGFQYGLVSLVAGWVLAWIVNFVVGLIKK